MLYPIIPFGPFGVVKKPKSGWFCHNHSCLFIASPLVTVIVIYNNLAIKDGGAEKLRVVNNINYLTFFECVETKEV